MYHIFFIHSSDNGHLGCFHVLAIVNSVAMNIGAHVFFSYGFLRVYAQYLRVARSYGRFIPTHEKMLNITNY